MLQPKNAENAKLSSPCVEGKGFRLNGLPSARHVRGAIRQCFLQLCLGHAAEEQVLSHKEHQQSRRSRERSETTARNSCITAVWDSQSHAHFVWRKRSKNNVTTQSSTVTLMCLQDGHAHPPHTSLDAMGHHGIHLSENMAASRAMNPSYHITSRNDGSCACLSSSRLK